MSVPSILPHGSTSPSETESRTFDAGCSQRCPRCGAAFVCGVNDGTVRCWCADLPVLQGVIEAAAAAERSADSGCASCYCPTCLRELLAAQSASD
ncbi:conserved protein of unknown function [Sterolibacterium denitrificans]|uniref:Cysteine-rich CWC n=1 Tax=Sterolibacterium denitrificans TaxID=157592 RepID=A0A7Z7HRD7_9PROT|nr:conserved protein of unknown function [Sterolibacterium denitrificans]